MEKDMDKYVKELIDIDINSVELSSSKELELKELESRYKTELKQMNEAIRKDAAELAQKKHDEIMAQAVAHTNTVKASTVEKLKTEEAEFEKIKEKAAEDIWKQLLGMER